MSYDTRVGGLATVKQHGFRVKDGYSIPSRIEEELPSSAESHSQGALRDAVAPVGFRGLLDICNSASLAPPSARLMPGEGRVEVVGTAHSCAGVRNLIKSVQRGLKAHQVPVAAEGGLGGTYFFSCESGRQVAIMKPCDEEPLAVNNPKGYVGRALGEPGLKPTVRVGEAAMREVAAFLLDHHHFARVPHTVLVKLTHPIFHVALGSDTPMEAGVPTKLGSLQEFAAHECDTSEMGASCFAARDVHRIGILDIRLYNTDRHAGNILVRRPRNASSNNLSAVARFDERKLELIPIDHGFCLPEALEPPYFEWLHWPQAQLPFDAEELQYIADLSAADDVALLRSELPALREESLHTLEVATVLLQMCAAAGLTLAEIGTVVSRPLVGLDEEPSELEKICHVARQEVEAWAAEEALRGLCVEGNEEESALSPSAGTGGSAHSPAVGFSGSSGPQRVLYPEGAGMSWRAGLRSESGSQELMGPLEGSPSSTGSPPRSPGELLLRRSTDELLFDLDEEGSGPTHSPQFRVLSDTPFASRGKPPPPGGRDSSHISPDSTLFGFQCSHSSSGSISSLARVDECGAARQDADPLLPLWQRTASTGAQDGCPSPALVNVTMPVAQSVADGGFFWRKGVGPGPLASVGTARPVRQRSRPPHRHRVHGGQIYPPHVQGGAPASTNNVFSGLSGERWEVFMEVVVEQIQAGLEAGRWRQQAQQGPRGRHNFGMSLPTRF
ncbi:hypothetical protein WJX72_001297 [[Myrmecia] bisecta]|uniref:1-phosphatidylinositol 4-kinase n=1 Tax=[Myrmecia] bisecta TaxID=41462 RepID=A0AAW1R4C8_9CHLO